ncbi:hypothetical protein Tco_0086101 [Tanacetum coccineum]
MQQQNYSLEEWLKVKVRHTNVNKSVKNAVLNEWILDSLNVEADFAGIRNDPNSKSLDEYKAIQGNDQKGDGHRRKCLKKDVDLP